VAWRGSAVRPCRAARDDAPEAAVAAAERLTTLFSILAGLRAAAERAPATLELAARTAAAEAELAAFKDDTARELAEWDARFGTQTAEAPREALIKQLLKLPVDFGAALTSTSSAAAGAGAALARLSTPELRLLAQANLASARRAGADAVAALRAAEAAALASRAQQLQRGARELPKPAEPLPAAASASADSVYTAQAALQVRSTRLTSGMSRISLRKHSHSLCTQRTSGAHDGGVAAFSRTQAQP
jgi:hypothetical protein